MLVSCCFCASRQHLPSATSVLLLLAFLSDIIERSLATQCTVLPVCLPTSSVKERCKSLDTVHAVVSPNRTPISAPTLAESDKLIHHQDLVRSSLALGASYRAPLSTCAAPTQQSPDNLNTEASLVGNTSRQGSHMELLEWKIVVTGAAEVIWGLEWLADRLPAWF